MEFKPSTGLDTIISNIEMSDDMRQALYNGIEDRLNEWADHIFTVMKMRTLAAIQDGEVME